MKSVIFSTCTTLPCAGSENTEIIVCLVSNSLLTSGKKTFQAMLINTTKVCEDLCNLENHWHYNIQYDEDLLSDPETPLISDDIKAIFCVDNCVLNYVEDQISDAFSSRNIFTGSGTPEGVVTASKGSIFLRSDGGAGTSFYVKESGTGNTGWIGK